MQPWHRAGKDATATRLEPAALDQFVSLAQALDELRQLAEIVAVVRVAHDHEPSVRGVDAAHQCGAVTLVGHRHDPRPLGARDVHRRVGAAVVGHDNLADDAGRLHGGERLADAGRQCVRLVEAGHDDGQLDVVVRSSVRGLDEAVVGAGRHQGRHARRVQPNPTSASSVLQGCMRDPNSGGTTRAVDHLGLTAAQAPSGEQGICQGRKAGRAATRSWPGRSVRGRPDRFRPRSDDIGRSELHADAEGDGHRPSPGLVVRILQTRSLQRVDLREAAVVSERDLSVDIEAVVEAIERASGESEGHRRGAVVQVGGVSSQTGLGRRKNAVDLRNDRDTQQRARVGADLLAARRKIPPIAPLELEAL